MPDAPEPHLRPWKRAALVVNTRSRKGRRQFDRARALLRAKGIVPEWEIAVGEPARLADEIRKVLALGADLVISGGGDGSQSASAGVLRGTGAILAPLPLGTANSFVRTLDESPRLDDAIATIATGRSAMIDIAEIDGHVLLNSAALGISPRIGLTIPSGLKRWLGQLGYLVWALRILARFRPFRLTIDGGGEPEVFWATELRLLNGRYHGGVELSEEARLDSGQLVLQVVIGRSRWNLVRDWLRHVVGMREDPAIVIERSGPAFRIDAAPAQKVSIDGEVLARTPVAVRVCPGALRVMVPADGPLSGTGKHHGR